MDTLLDIANLQKKTLQIRKDIITMVYQAQSGHIGGSLGAVEIMVALYYHIMQHQPGNPSWADRDRFILSKGHCAPVLYAILADCGYFPKNDLNTFRKPGSHLQGHPYQPKTPGIEASTGTLGLGISTATGMALAAKWRGNRHRYYVLCGDGELQEGQVWEAAMFAHKYQLNNLMVIVDRNYLQTDGHSEDIMPLDPLAEKWAAFGWAVFEINGHDLNDIIHTIQTAWMLDRPIVLIAYTTKGKGVPFMENETIWHGLPPGAQDYQRAMEALDTA